MNTIKISARTVDEARTQAMISLGISSDRLEYTVISEPKKGFLGIGAKQAVIEAWAKEDRATKELDTFMNTSAKEQVSKLEEKAEEKQLKKNTVKPAKKKENRDSDPQQVNADKKFEKKVDKKPEKKIQQKADERVEHASAANNVVNIPKKTVEAKENKQPAETKYPVENKVVEKKVDNTVDKVEKSTESVENKDNSVAEVKAEPKVKLKIEDIKGTPEEFITKVCNAMGIDVQLETTFDDKDNVLDINMLGDDMGILIGKRGQTLDSLQYLTGLVVNKEQGEYIRVKLDTENYRERRKDTLENLAKNIAHKVTKTRRSVALEPMNPYERRVIHAALQNDKFVCTRSEGEEPFRHVVVSLKKDVNLAPRNRGGKNFKGSYKNNKGGYNRRRDVNRNKKPASNTSEGQKTE